MTAPVRRAAHVGRPPEETFALFTEHLTAWWPLETHGVYGPESAGVRFADGRLVESSLDGRESVWGEVLAWEPPERFVISWHPGRDGGTASEVEVSFAPEAGGTWVRVEHRGWEQFGVDALVRRDGYARPNAWGAVLDHFSDVADVTTRPQWPELAAACEAFLAEAARGGFGAAPPGEWDAARTIAHVALNDAAMAGVARAIIHERAVRFDNLTCQEHAVLDAFVTGCGSFDGLVARARANAADAMLALGRLDDDQLATEVPCRLFHDGAIVLDRPMAWGELAGRLQAVRHLPAHVEQLRKLRG